MQAVEVLRHEHRVIERGLAVLEAMAHRMEHGETVPVDKVQALLEFFRVFADQYHHGKEEGMLFPELEARGIPHEGGPIGVMLSEHDQGRALIAQMTEATNHLSDSMAQTQFVQAAHGYIQLLRQHISKEDNVLFKMAEGVLSAGDDRRLTDAFERHERDATGLDVHEHFHHLIHELEHEFLSEEQKKGASGS